MKELTYPLKDYFDPYKPIAYMLLAYLRDFIYEPKNASLNIALLPEGFAHFGEALQYFCSLVAEAGTFARELSAGNLSCAAPPPRNELAAPLKNLHATLKHLTWQTQQVAQGDYLQRVDFMGDFSNAFNHMITQLAQAQKTSALEKTRLERDVNLLLANSPNPVLLFDRQGHLTYANNAYLQHCMLSGIDRILGKHIAELLTPYVSAADLHEIMQQFDIATIAKLTTESENEIHFNNDGDSRHVKMQIAPMIGIDNEVEGLMVFLIDMTHSILAYREARQARKIAEQAARAKSDFLARMSHEIRTPMNAIIGMTELALREDMPLAVREHILTIQQAGANLLSIINDILDFTKIETGILEIVPEEYGFSSLVENVISIVRMKVLGKRLRFVVNLDCNIPEKLFGDGMKIRQVLINLVNNAVKYTENGFVTLTVTGAIRDASTVDLTMEIMDSGRGIKQEDIPYLFREFSRLDLTNHRKIEGTGLGLAIARKLVKAMGGDIAVASAHGKGTIFTVALPQKYRARHKLASVEKPEEKRVLIYESRALYANSIVCALDNLGVYCEIACRQDEFYEKMAAQSFSCIFISSVLYEKNKNTIAQLGTNAKIVLLVGFSEVVAWKQRDVLAMPAQSISIANILNGVSEEYGSNHNPGSFISFTAPDAKILIVDDIITNLEVASGLLKPYKMKIDLCENGFDAIEKVQLENYDLVFMDHMMPELDGIETVARIRELGDDASYYKKLPIIALTANAMSSAKDMFLKNNFNDFLSKPINPVEIDAALTKWVAKEKQVIVFSESFSEPAAHAGQYLEIMGVDVRKGIAQSGGTLKNYVQTLSAFHKDVLEKITQIQKCPDSNTLPLYVTYVHALKSASMSIGAIDVSRISSALEAAGLQRDFAYIKLHNHELVKALETLLNNLGEVLPAYYETARRYPENSEMLRAEFANLKTALENFDAASIDRSVNELQESVLTSDIGAIVDDVLLNILIGDYDTVISFIEDVLQESSA